MSTRRLRVQIVVVGGLLVGLAAPVVFGLGPPGVPSLPNFDRRQAVAQNRELASAELPDAVARLQGRARNVQIARDEATGPVFVSRRDGFLSGPNGEGEAIPAATALRIAANDRHRPVKGFLDEYSPLFGHDSSALASAIVTRDYVTPHNGMRTTVWQQQLDDIPIFEALLVGNTTSRGELINISSRFLPDPARAADAGEPNRRALQAAPTISPQRAVVLAAGNLGAVESLEGQVTQTGPAQDADRRQRFTAPGLSGGAEARLVWLPLNRSTLRICWDVVLTVRSRGEMYRVLIDAGTGEVLVRRCLTSYISDATYRVFTSDSPSPYSPGCPTPCTNQPAVVSRTLVTISALDTNASPNGWINDGDNTTSGNNVDAYLDRANDNTPKPADRATGSPSRVFDFPLDLAQDPVVYTNAAVVQLFYWNNWMHDRLYQLGFTEEAGNFQADNFGRGGLSNDAVRAEAQDGSGTDNSNFSTPPDGQPPRMQMYLFTGPTPDRDGDLDAEVILHEYAHGLSDRVVGGGVGLSALQSEGLGEGWSDFYALALLSGTNDDVNGTYAFGGYVSYQFSGLTQNYHFGIRRYPYATDLTKNPLTFKDIDPGQASLHPGIPRSPVIGNTADEVHNMGELWCVTLWEARANLIEKYGYETGNQLILQLVTDGMKLSPANPNYIEARDAIFEADQVDNSGANYSELWAAFAKRGMGLGASAPTNYTTVGVVESFFAPWLSPQTVAVSGGNGNGVVDPNECIDLNIVLHNGRTNTASNITATLSTTMPGVTVVQPYTTYPDIGPGASASNTFAFRINTAPSFVCGTPVDLTLTVLSSDGIDTNSLVLPPAVLYYTLTTSNGVAIVPGDTDIGNHADDETTSIALPFAYTYYGQAYTNVVVSSNGNLQFGSANNSFVNACLPASNFGGTMFPYWDDLSTVDFIVTNRGVFTSVSGSAPHRIFNIEWRTTYYDEDTQIANFEMRLYEDQPRFDVIYGEVDQGGTNATVGIQEDSSLFTQVGCNAGGITSGLQLSFRGPACDGGGPCDSDDDDIPDVWMMQYFGHALGMADDRSRAEDDADDDGMSNLQEFLAGTNPTDQLSALRIIDLAQEGANMLVTWTTAGGHTNVVEATVDLGASYSNISPNIVILGIGDAVTNYLDSGAAALTQRFYRVKLLP